ncbi:MAG: YdeI/OmpD-associated family protein [Armatimonadota bacterium]|nr:YdeI/OmpD-associated family protein [bacterium]
MKYDFSAEIKLLEGKMKWSVIYFPHSALEHFGTNGRVNVRAVVDSHKFDGTLLPSRNGHYLVYNSAMKKVVGKRLGDSVRVTFEKCDEERKLIVPDYILTALKENAVLDKFLEMPDYIKREEINKIESAQRDETKSRRLQTLIAKLTPLQKLL